MPLDALEDPVNVMTATRGSKSRLVLMLFVSAVKICDLYQLCKRYEDRFIADPRERFPNASSLRSDITEPSS